jgi:hypothetical protein
MARVNDFDDIKLNVLISDEASLSPTAIWFILKAPSFPTT